MVHWNWSGLFYNFYRPLICCNFLNFCVSYYKNNVENRLHWDRERELLLLFRLFIIKFLISYVYKVARSIVRPVGWIKCLYHVKFNDKLSTFVWIARFGRDFSLVDKARYFLFFVSRARRRRYWQDKKQTKMKTKQKRLKK